MKIARTLCVALVLACSLSAGAQAKENNPKPYPHRSLTEKAVARNPDVIESTNGYILIRLPNRGLGSFVRVPDAEDIADYEILLDNQFAKEVKKYNYKMKLFEYNKKLLDVMTESQIKSSGIVRLEEPVYPTRDSISIIPIELITMVDFRPEDKFSVDAESGDYYYLHVMKPGTYIYYGQSIPLVGGTCYCMGSVRFEVKPGVVTNLGNFLHVAPDQAAQITADLATPDDVKGAQPPVYAVPAALAGVSVVQAHFEASGKMDNFFGGTVSRMPPVPGVLAYWRDTVIDVASNMAVLPGVEGKRIPLDEKVSPQPEATGVATN